MITEKSADRLFWIGGIAIAISAFQTIHTGTMTNWNAAILLAGLFVGGWGLLKVGRLDVFKWIYVAIVALLMALEWATKR